VTDTGHFPWNHTRNWD